VGVPHLSRYDISPHNDVVSWIKRLPKPRRCCLTSKWRRRADGLVQ
jgi:hypothetical protein